jgi:hypothetical protein
MFQVESGEQTDTPSATTTLSNSVIKVHVHNRKFLKKDSHLGTVIVPMDTLQNEQVRKEWFKLPEVDGITGAIMLKIQYSASDRGKMNLLKEITSIEKYNPLHKALTDLSTRSFLTLFDHNSLIPSTTEIESLLKVIISSETNGVNRNDVLKLLIDTEVQASASSVGTLFRRNSLASKVLTAYLNYYGNRYLISRLQNFVQQLDDADEDLEVDPHRVNPESGKVDTKKNMKIILKKLEELLKFILDAPNEVPYEIRESNYILSQSVSQVFAKENKGNAVVHTAVGGAMFLRFICPALTSPHLNGLLKNAPKRKAHRTLMIVTKILQNLANGVEFGKKEDFMTSANKLIKKQKKPFVKFVESVIAQSLNPSMADDVDSNQLLWSLYTLHGYMNKNWTKIYTDLTKTDGTPLPFSILSTNTDAVKQVQSEIVSVRKELDTLGEQVELKKENVQPKNVAK